MFDCRPLPGVMLAIILTLTCVTGCTTTPRYQGYLEREVQGAELSSLKLRWLTSEFVLRFATRVEREADAVIASTSDPLIRRNALLWKSNAISACLQAGSRSDPMGAFLDCWILTRQMMRLFESQEIEPHFGREQGRAVALARTMDQELRQIYFMLGQGIEPGEAFVQSFADQYPITDLYFVRESFASHLIKDIKEHPRELSELIAVMNEDLAELQKLSALYAEFLPKQARWHAEIMAIEMVEGPLLSRPLHDVSLASQSAVRLATFVEQTPLLIERERRLMWEFVRQERHSMFADLDAMRGQTTAELRAEREAVMEALKSERMAVTSDVETLVDQTLERTDDMIRERTEQIAAQGQVAIDVVTRRTLQAIGIIAVVVILIGLVWFSRRRTVKRRTDEPRPLRMATQTPDEGSESKTDQRRAA